jgi:hypothetical protein
MVEIFKSDVTSYFNRLFKGFIKQFVLIWIIWLIIYLVIIPDNNINRTMLVFLILTVFFAVLTIPKFRYFLISIEHSDNNIVLSYLDYNKLNQEVIPIENFNIELKNAFERGVTYKLLFSIGDRLILTIFAKKQNIGYDNKSFFKLYNQLTELQKGNKPSMSKKDQ